MLILTLTLHVSNFSFAESQKDAKSIILEKLVNFKNYVSTELPADTETFDVKTPNAAEGHRKALVNKIKALINQVNNSWPHAREGAIKKLENDLTGKVEKWIKSEDYKSALLQKIEEILDLIKGVPVAAFSFTPETPVVGQVVTFDASESYDLDGTIVNYLWNFGDGTNDTGMIVEHAYATPGTFTVTLTVIDNDELSDTAEDEVEVSPLKVHDIAIVSVIPSPTRVVSGQTVEIQVTAENQGNFTESFSVTAYYDSTVIDTQNVDELAPQTMKSLTFFWNTTDVSEGNYTISAAASVVDGEVDTNDNAFIDNIVTIVSPPIHDLAITNIVSSPSVVKVGDTITINVTVLNEGTATENFSINVYYNLTLLETRTNIVLVAGAETTLTFDWVTTSEGIYLIWAEVPALPGEIDVDDNKIVDGIVTVTLFQSPVALFTFSPSTPYTGQDVIFDASSSYDRDGTIINYIWDFGDNTTGYGETVTHEYADDGDYVVELTVVDNDGLNDTLSQSIEVRNRPPVALFTESVTSVPTGTTINFNASLSYDPDGNIVEYSWDFGDNTSATGVIVSHSYADDGVYTVTLTITDDDGVTARATATKNISNRPPVASFTQSADIVYTGELIRFNASESYDPDGKVVSYFWEFGDGTNDTGVTAKHAYADDGLYIVTLTVTDDDGATMTVTAAKAVLNRPPTASFTENATTAYNGETIRFDASNSFDPDGYITSYFWNFGDGTNATGVTVDHVYADNGNYTVTLTITDDDNAIAIATATKIILNIPPTASFTESATTVKTGVVISFDASDSYDPDGTIVKYTWNFGDGTNATGMTVTHSYTDDGTYTVTLTVTDNDGATASYNATKTVLNRPPVASFTASAITVFTGEVIQFNASESYDPDGTIESYRWDFGDGTKITTSIPIVNHTYTTGGIYNVTLTVIDDDGLTDEEVKTFTVETPSWPLWLIIAIILLILAATAVAIYLWRKRRKKGQGIGSRAENYKLTILLCF
jgi:PKD repeat protein